MSGFRMVYSVGADERRMEIDRHAATNPNIVRDDLGTLGTPEWWKAVQEGRIPTRMRFVTVTGIEPYNTRGFPLIHFIDSEGQEGRCEMFGPEESYKPGVKLALMEWQHTLYPQRSMISPREIRSVWFVFEIWVAGETGLE